MSSSSQIHLVSLCLWLVCSTLSTTAARAQGETNAERPAQADVRLLAEQTARWMENYAALPPALQLGERFKPGYLESVDFRTESDEFLFSQQRYAIRVKPKLPHIRKAEQRLQDAQRERLSSIDGEARGDAYADALRLLFELATDQRELLLLDTLREVQRKLADASRKRLAEPDYDVEDALDYEADLADLELRQLQVRALAEDNPPPISLDRVVGFSDVRERLRLLTLTGPDPLEGVAAELAENDAEARLERAENQQWLDFVQLEYLDGRGSLFNKDGEPVSQDLFGQRARIGGGITLPMRAKKLRNLDELTLERLEIEHEAALDERERTREFNDEAAEILRSIEQHEALRSRFRSRADQRERLLEAYLRSQLTRPETILRLRRRGLRDQLDLLQIEEDIREAYADLVARYTTLDAAGLARWVLR